LSACQAGSDSVEPGQPLIEISPSGAAKPSTVTRQARLWCYTTLRVTQGGSATATFGTVAACVLTQVGSGVGSMVSRYPANMLFSLTEGAVTCASRTAQGQQAQAQVCGEGTVYLAATSTTWDATCGADHMFRIKVYRGSVQVGYAGGKPTLRPFSQLAFDPRSGTGKISTGISFSAAEISTFDTLKP